MACERKQREDLSVFTVFASCFEKPRKNGASYFCVRDQQMLNIRIIVAKKRRKNNGLSCLYQLKYDYLLSVEVAGSR